MTFRKVTPAALKVNVKKFWQVLLVPWHVWAPIWVHFAPWWSIFPVKNRFSHIFPVPGGLPFLTVILTVKLARLGWRPFSTPLTALLSSLPPMPHSFRNHSSCSLLARSVAWTCNEHAILECVFKENCTNTTRGKLFHLSKNGLLTSSTSPQSPNLEFSHI